MGGAITVNRHHILAGFFGFLLLLAEGAPLAAQTRYQVIDLGTLGGNSSFALYVNIHRQVTGNSRTGTTTLPLLAYIWEDGALTNIGVLPGSNNCRGYGINDLGVIVGESDNNASMAFPGKMDPCLTWGA
jgi:uncharacterized membrane protein